MSSFLRLFGDRNKSKQSTRKVESISSSQASASHSATAASPSAVDLLQDFSDDEVGHELRRLWGDYNSAASADLAKSALHSLSAAVLEAYDRPEAVSSSEGVKAAVIGELARHLFHALRDDRKEAELKEIVDFEDDSSLPRVISLDALHQESPEGPRWRFFLDVLRALKALLRWPRNCLAIRKMLEIHFARLVLSLGREIQRLIQQCSEGDVHLFQALVLVVGLIGQGTSPQPLEFSDFLPPQPWSQPTWQRCLQGGNESWDTVSAHGDDSLADALAEERKLKSAYLHNIAIAGGLQWLMEALTSIVNTRCSPVFSNERVQIWCGIAEAEILFATIGLCSTFTELFPADLAFFSAVEKSFSMFDPSSNSVHKPLFIRKQLLCLRFNALLLNHLRRHKTEAPHHSLRLLPSAAIARFFAWLSNEYDHVPRMPGDWVEQIAQSKGCFVSINLSLSVGKVASRHDLWTHGVDQDDEQHPSESSNGADFHILPKDVRSLIHNQIRAFAGSWIWDSVVAEVLGSYMLSTLRPHSTSSTKVKKDNLHYVYEVFDFFFRGQSMRLMNFEASDDNDDDDGQSDMSLPLTQLKFIDFLSQTFKAADPSAIFSIINEFETFRFLLGDKFLLAHSVFPRYLADLFQDVTASQSKCDSFCFRASVIKRRHFHCLYLWIYLQNAVLDFFHGLVVYSIYFHANQHSVQAYLSYEDILLVLTQYMKSLCKHTRFPGHLVYQLSLLVLNLDSIVRSMALDNNPLYLQRMVRHVLDIVDNQLRGKSIAASEKNALELAGCFGVVQLLLHFLQPSDEVDQSCKDVFLDCEACAMLDLAQELSLMTRGRNGVSTPHSNSSNRLSISSAGSVSFSSPPARAERVLSESNLRPGESGEKGIRLRQLLVPVAAMLMSDQFQVAGLEILQAIVVSSAQAMTVIQDVALDQEGRQKRKQALRTLAAEVFGLLFHLLSISYKFSNRAFAILTGRRCLDAVTNILRDPALLPLRIHIQEFIRRENMIYELLRSLSKSLHGHELVRSRSNSEDESFDGWVSNKAILLAGLTTLSAVVCGNEACKNTLRALLSSSREKVSASKARFASSMVDSKEKDSPVLLMKSASGLVSLILCGQRSPGQDIIVILFDMMLDGPHARKEFLASKSSPSTPSSAMVNLFAHEDDKPTIRNTAILPDFFQLIPHCSLPIQRFALESFRNLVSGRGSLVNLAVCSSARPKVFDIVLDLFPYIPDSIQTCNAELLDFLGRYMVSVSSLKHLFRILQRNDGSSPAYAWKVIQALQGMFRDDCGPKHTFVFDGNQSGLLLPAIYRWPKTKGFSFSCWLRVESPKIDYNSISYVPRVFSLRDQNGCGFQLLLKQPKPGGAITLCFQYINDQGATLSASPEPHYGMELMEDKWYFLALSLTSPHFYARSELKLYLDHLLYKEEISLWKMPETVPEPLIGGSSAGFRMENEHQTLRGQLGAIYFFGEALTDQQVQGIYALGPDYIYNFEPHSAGYKELMQSSSKRLVDKKSILDDGSVTAKILLAYNPVVLRGKYFVDNTPEKNEVLWRLPNGVEVNDDLRADLPKHCRMHAMRLPGTYRSTLQDVRLALNSLGGIKVVIPLFAQLISHDRDREANCLDQGCIVMDCPDSNFFPAVLGLLTTLLEDSDENKRVFMKCGGFSVIRDFLEKAPAGYFNLITLNQFAAILENLKDDSTAREACFDNVLCNFKLWSRASAEVQICWLDWLNNALASLHWNCLYSPQRFIDTLYFHFDYLSVEFSQISLEKRSEKGISTLFSKAPSLSDDQLQLVRSKVYRLIQVVINQEHSSSFEAAAGLMKYAMLATDLRSKTETLRFLEALLININGQDKKQGILICLTSSDAMLCLDRMLAIQDNKLFQAVMGLVSAVAHLASIISIDRSTVMVSSSSKAMLSSESDEQVSVIKSEQASPVSMRSQRIEANQPAKSMAFIESSDWPNSLSVLSDAAVSNAFRFQNPATLEWTLLVFVQLMLGMYQRQLTAGNRGEEQDLGLRRMSAMLQGGALLVYPELLGSVFRLLSSTEAVSLRSHTSLLMRSLSAVLATHLVRQAASIVHWEAYLAVLLCRQSGEIHGAASSDDHKAFDDVRHVLQVMLLLIRSESEIIRIRVIVQSLRDAFVAAGRAAECFPLISVVLLECVCQLSGQQFDPGNSSDLLRMHNIGLAVIEHLMWCGKEVVGTQEKEKQTTAWQPILRSLIDSPVGRSWSPYFKAILSDELCDNGVSVHAMNWKVIKLFLCSLFGHHTWRSLCDVVDSEIDSLWNSSQPRSSDLWLSLFPDSEVNIGSVVEKRVFRSAAVLPVIGMRIVCLFHRTLLEVLPGGNWSGCLAPIYAYVLRCMEMHNYELFAFERLHLISMAAVLRLPYSPETLVDDILTNCGGEINDLISVAFHREAGDSQEGMNDSLGIVIALLDHNVVPSTFKDRFLQVLANTADDEASPLPWLFPAAAENTEIVEKLMSRQTSSPEQLADRALLWKNLSVFLQRCGWAVIESMTPNHLEVDPLVRKLSFDHPILAKDGIIETEQEEVSAWISRLEWERLAVYYRLQEIVARRAEMKRSRLFSQLANERGPWGYSVDHVKEIFWTLDSNENACNLRLRLKRNLMGTRHMIATFKSTGRLKALVEENPDLANSGPRGWIEMDLQKFKTRSPVKSKSKMLSADDKDKEDDDLSDVDEDAGGDDGPAIDSILLADSELLSFNVEIISPATNSSGGKTSGKLEVSRLKMSFQRHSELADYDFENKTGNNEFLWACQCFPSMSWSGSDITGVYRRHYQLRYVALEVFFTNRTSLFFNLFESNAAKRVYSFLVRRMKTPNLNMIFTGRPQNAISRVFTASGLTLTQAWVARKISNFDYLMFLNFIAGRSFNDLAQYPVFPWVLSNYTSSKIDLRNPKNYRRFDRPMGAQLDSQRDLLMEKYLSSLQLQDDSFYPYHSGSHYSTSAMVLWYLIRMEPFTSYHVWLQDGKFDRPDRLFHSIAHAYHGCTTNTQDVKELIPEFFCNPEFLSNLNNVNLGTRQDGEVIDNVSLPKWCKDPADFVRINRDALESEYVSSQLHHWIDLIFGCKQRPPFLNGGSEKAVLACNVFFHLSYADAVDLDAMKASDPDIYNRTVRQIDNYGQTPMQLFKKDHPRRKSLQEVQDILWPIASVLPGADTVGTFQDESGAFHAETTVEKPKRVLCYGACKISKLPVIFLAACSAQERLVTVDTNRVLGYHLFQMRNPSHVPPFNVKLDKTTSSQTNGQVGSRSASSSFISYLPYSSTSKEKVVGIPFASAVVLSPSLLDNITMQSSSSLAAPAATIGLPQNKVKYLEEEVQALGRPRDERRGTMRSASSRQMPSTPSSASLVDMDKSMTSASWKDLSSPSGVNEGKDEPPQLSVDQTASTEASHNPLTGLVRDSPSSESRKTNQKKADRVDYHLSSHLFYCMGPLKLIFSCGHWDNTFKVTSAETGRLIQSISHHREVVTCIAGASDFGRHWIVVGSKDCTVTVWEIFPERETEPVHATPAHTLYGHDDTVNCLVVNAELDLIVSGSDDGTIMIHSLREGSYIRSIIVGAITDTASVQASPSQGSRKSIAGMSMDGMVSPMTPRHAVQANTQSQQFTAQQLEKALCRVHLLGLSKDGHIVAFSNDGHILASYTQNGRYLKLIQVRERIHAMCLSEDGRTVLTGGERGLVVIRWVHNLAIASTGARRGLESVIDGSNEPDFEPFSAPIRSLAFTANERHLLVGLDNGEVRILAQDSEYLRRKLHRQLIEIGMLSI